MTPVRVYDKMFIMLAYKQYLVHTDTGTYFTKNCLLGLDLLRVSLQQARGCKHTVAQDSG